MTTALLLFPDFTLILLGWLLYRYFTLGDAFWSGLEKLIYFILFPALLFNAILQTPFSFDSAGQVMWIGLAATGSGVVLGYLARWLFRPDSVLFASGVQCAFRFNSYIALALAGRVGGEAGIAWMALLIGINVPLCNAAAVWALARHSKLGVGREMARNPLILATLSGLTLNLLGIQLPDFVGATLGRLGAASLALGLLAVGAGLRLTGSTGARGLVSYWLAVKLFAMPCLTYAIARWQDVPPLQLQVLVMFAALPTASSAYILATRLGGNGAIVAFLISSGTLISILSLPLWLWWLGS